MRRALARPAALTLVLLLGLTGVATWVVRGAVRSQEDRLLHERANEVSLVLKEAVDSLSSQLQTVGGALRVTNANPKAFARATAPLVGGTDPEATIALVRRTAAGFRVAQVGGTALRPGQTLTGPRAATLAQAGTSGQMVPTHVMGSGSDRTIGFALGPPDAPPGTVLYLQVGLGMLGPPRAADTSPFNELRVVLYDSHTPDPAQALITTTDDVPLRGDVRVVPVAAGSATWTLQVSPAHPLVGEVTARAAWLTLGGGLLLSALITLIVEIETRRRRSALTLYRNERQLAEGLQRSLLPALPTLRSLELAARYLAGSADQQIGGDWYDVFPLEGDRIGLVVGDVLGHDIDAAALMSRVQAALRAYAFVGEPPGAVLDLLDRLLSSLGTERLVTVFFGVLGPPAEDGTRLLRYANAGHPPPLLHDGGDVVRDLDGAGSLLLGVPGGPDSPRLEHTVSVTPGATLVLYTDGLVEVPGQSLSEQVELLRRTTAAEAPRRTAEQLCDRLLGTIANRPRRDDVAVLAARLAASEAAPAPAPRGTGRIGLLRARR